jgi:hypothetical protein
MPPRSKASRRAPGAAATSTASVHTASTHVNQRLRVVPSYANPDPTLAESAPSFGSRPGRRAALCSMIFLLRTHHMLPGMTVAGIPLPEPARRA